MFNKILVNTIILATLLTLVSGVYNCAFILKHPGTPPLISAPNHIKNGLQKEIIHWQELPIKIYKEGELYLDFSLAIHIAIKQWNKMAGCKIFALTEDNKSFIRISQRRSPKKKTWLGAARYVPRGSGWGSNIHLYEALALKSPRSQVSTVIHELGHALGLDHVRDSSAIMHKASQENKYISPHQLKFVQDTYCKKPDGVKR